jgi:hypothetical protein
MRRKITYAAAIATVLVVAAGPVATAVIGSDGYYHGCFLKNAEGALPKGNLRLIGEDRSCRDNEGTALWQAVAVSDVNAKEGFRVVDPRAVLAKIDSLPLSTWSYKDDPRSVRHVGPMAQDFQRLFAVGPSDKLISPIDANGVAYAAIKGLSEMTRAQQAQIQQLRIAFVGLLTLIGIAAIVMWRKKRFAG